MLVTVSIVILRRYAKLLANQAWKGMERRTSAGYHQHSYHGVELRMTRAEFEKWAIPKLVKWFRTCPEKIPSIDRIDPTGHYELSNIRLLDVCENRSSNKRNTHRFSPDGMLWCPRCKKHLAKEDFYERPSVPLTETNQRMHWSAQCKECTKAFMRERWAKEHPRPDPTGLCERCNKQLPVTRKGKISRRKLCGSCVTILCTQKRLKKDPTFREHLKELAKLRTRRYRARKKLESSPG